MASEKEERYARVARAVAHQLVHGRPEGVRVSSVARRARVSRPWVYKYFGADPAALLQFAVREFGAAFAELERVAPEAGTWRSSVLEGMRRGLRDAQAAPWCVALYFRYRYDPGVMGEGVRAIEESHRAKFLAELPADLRTDPAGAARFCEFVHAARWGVFHRWIDPSFRAAYTEDDAVAEFARAVDHYLAEVRGR